MDPAVLKVEPAPPVTVVSKDQGLTVAPTTTEQEDITLASRRRVNLIWEFTQAIIAISVVLGYVGIVLYSAVSGKDVKVPESLTNIIMVVLTFYFVRTNHTAVGGIVDKYTGR